MNLQTACRHPGLRCKLAPVIAVVAAMLAGLPADVAAEKPRSTYEQRLKQEIQRRGVDPARVTLPFELTEEIRRWAREVAPRKLSHSQKLQRLATALLDPEQLELEYTWGHTGTAAEVYARRQANCLAFTNLFLGMAREVGVPVFFLAVEDVATYRKAGDLVVVSDHMVVGYGSRRELTIYDFSEERGPRLLEGLRAVSDLTAIAMFHSNRGAEALQQARVEESIDWLETAIALDPELSNAWVNLGVSRRREGDATGAEDAYKRALELDPGTYSAYQNLTSMLYFLGREEEARGYEETLAESPSKNPFTFLSLGDISFQSGRLAEARRFYRRALSLGHDAESYAALGELAVVTGDLKTARKMLRKAQKLDLDNRRTVRLANRMGTERS